MRLKTFIAFGLLILGTSLVHGATSSTLRSTTLDKKIVQSEAGLNIPDIGVAIDAVYEKKLDNLIPGYKLLLVVVTNKTTKSVYFDPKKDRWAIRDHLNHLHKGSNHPRLINKKIWENLPLGLKNDLKYPQVVHEGHTAKIDLLFPASVNLENFRMLIWKSIFFKKEFHLQTEIESENNNEMATPPTLSPNTEALMKSLETYKGPDVTPTEPDRVESKPDPQPEKQETTIPMD